MNTHCHDRFKTWISQTTGGDILGEVVVAELYDAAKSELAALREELENEALRTNDYCLRLTAVEQRNSELVDILTKAVGWFDDGVGRSDAEFDMLQDMRAALKPTESVVYQSREIGESDWADCSKEEYDRCGKDPHMDTRIKPAKSGASE